MPYRAPKAEARIEHEVKKSRFLGIAVPAGTVEDAEQALEAIRAEFPDATHHCWAYVIGNPAGGARVRSDDAGEPSGTAGKPILNVLQRREVGDVLLVVVRYFGGVKLGAGGLVRAYSTAASRAVDELELVLRSAKSELRIRLDYGDEPSVRRALERLETEIVSVSYDASVEIVVRGPESDLSSLIREIEERTSGRARIESPWPPWPARPARPARDTL